MYISSRIIKENDQIKIIGRFGIYTKGIWGTVKQDHHEIYYVFTDKATYGQKS